MAPGPLDFLGAPTPALRALVAHYQRVLPATDFERLLAHLRERAQEYAAELGRLPPGAERARACHRLLDRALESSHRPVTSCGAGCSACCHLEVEVTSDEGALLAERVRNGQAVDRDHLGRQAARARQSSEWASLVAPQNRCVFLTRVDTCGIYPDRPSGCRKHLVSSPSARCGSPGGRLEPITVPLAELVTSVALALPQNSYGSLPKLLDARLGPRIKG